MEQTHPEQVCRSSMMAIRGAKNPFPKKMKPTTKVFSSPQKMDPASPKLKKERGVMEAAMKSDRKHMGGGMSASSVKEYAHRGPRQR
jgi:hypothetical protein